MDDRTQPDAKPGPRWKLLLWIEATLTLLWLALKKVPGFEEAGAGGAIDLVFVILIPGTSLLWLLFLSRLRWQVRLLGAGAALALAGLVKIDGHTGSFFPQFSWRWSKESALEIPELTGKVAEEGTVIETEGPEYFPRFLGSEMNNWVSGELLPGQWQHTKPKELWRKKIGEGWSAFSVAGGYAYTMEQRGKVEATICYELMTGEAVWVHEEGVRFEESMGSDGPRSTPTVIDGRVFSLGATGILNCLDARTGKLNWGKNVLIEVGQSVPTWAKSCSPLVVDGKVIVTLGSEAEKNLAAFKVTTGDLTWRSGDYSSSYTSPVLAVLAGKRQIVAFQQKSIDGYDIESGAILWSFPIGNRQGNCASPLIVDDTVITSSGYGHGTHRIKISPTSDGFEAKELWHSKKLKAKFADMVVKGDHLYGLNDGRLVCLNLEDGTLKWRGSNFGHGQMLGVGEHLILQGEQGDIAILEISPDEEKIVQEFEALDHRTWNHSTLAGRILLVRNDREAVAFQF
ncbi:PQQ-binding-like beta-propeller repeat protein [Verrucomicrobiaceae bacterium 227]